MNPYKHQFLMSLLAYAVLRNVKADVLCELSGLDLQKLKRNDHRDITEKTVHDLWYNAIRLTNDPLFGLHFGESLQLSALGVVGQIIQSSKTIGEGLQYACGSAKFITDLVGIDVRSIANRVTITYNTQGLKGKYSDLATRQFVDFFMVFTIHELDGLTLEQIVPLKVKTQVESKSQTAEYQRVFRCKPALNSREYCIELSGKYWNEPIITADYQLNSILLERQKKYPSRPDALVREKVAAYLNNNAFLGTVTIEEIAANFNLTPRTLQRRLSDEGVTFRQLVEETRKSLALHYLQVRQQPIKEVAYILGYNDITALARAFKRWTGTSPAAYQQSARR